MVAFNEYKDVFSIHSRERNIALDKVDVGSYFIIFLTLEFVVEVVERGDFRLCNTDQK
jgi:hypothetical protein